MTDARIVLDLQIGTATKALSGLAEQLGSDGRAQLLGRIGEYVVRSTRDRAALQVAPDGTAWAPLSPRYKRRKDKLRPGVKLLTFDNHMLGDRLVYQADSDSVLVGTNAPYGARQHFGGGGITARPWLGLSDEDEDQIARRVVAFLRAPLESDSGASP